LRRAQAAPALSARREGDLWSAEHVLRESWQTRRAALTLAGIAARRRQRDGPLSRMARQPLMVMLPLTPLGKKPPMVTAAGFK
jgi:hypothetical protein